MPTLAAYRRFTAPLLGPYERGTATANSTTVLLEMTTFPFKSSLSQDDLFTDQFIFRPNAAAAGNKTRVVAESGYDPDLGRFTPDLAWTAAPATDEVVELHGVLPPIGPSGENDLHFIINEALKRCLVVVEFTFTAASATAERHSMASDAAWLTDPEWVYQVGYLASGESRSNVNPFQHGRLKRHHPKKLGSTVYLEGFTLNTTDTGYVLATKPAYSNCKPTAGAFGDQSGLSLETDEAEPAEKWVAAAALREAWDRLGGVLAGGNGDKAKEKQLEWAAKYAELRDEHLTLPERKLQDDGPRRWGPMGL